MPDGSEDSDEEPDPATRTWDEREFLDEKYQEPDVSERYDVEPEIPEAPSPEEADPKVRARFWSLVVVFNVTVLALSVGGMFMLFRENVAVGAQLFAVGVVVGLYGLYRYRTAKQTLYDDQNG